MDRTSVWCLEIFHEVCLTKTVITQELLQHLTTHRKSLKSLDRIESRKHLTCTQKLTGSHFSQLHDARNQKSDENKLNQKRIVEWSRVRDGSPVKPVSQQLPPEQVWANYPARSFFPHMHYKYISNANVLLLPKERRKWSVSLCHMDSSIFVTVDM